MMTPLRWHILTGEYPPEPGGVADYTALLASSLAEAGAEVHVWTTTAAGSPREPEVSCAGVIVHREAGRWSPRDLARLGAALDAFSGPRILLAQHVPPLWGYRGLNLNFGRWLRTRRAQGDDVRVMFHEVRYHTRLFDKPTRWLLAAVQYGLVRDVLAASTCVYVSTPSWEPLLRRHGPVGRRVKVNWLPVPSNIPVITDEAGVAALRDRLAPDGETILGTFGTFSGAIAALLARSLPCLLLGRPDRRVLLLGRGGERFAAQLIAAHPSLDGRLVAPGPLPSADISRHLQVCDLFLQPYPDGITTRRTSTMAALAHGRAVVSNEGALTEPLWADSGALALAPAPEPASLMGAAKTLLGDPAGRAHLGAEARQFYERSFAIERTVETLLGATRERAGYPE